MRDEKDEIRENATMYETILAQWGWVGTDLDSRTKYKLNLAKKFGVPYAEAEAAYDEVRSLKAK